jgi:hypothetical protein
MSGLTKVNMTLMEWICTFCPFPWLKPRAVGSDKTLRHGMLNIKYSGTNAAPAACANCLPVYTQTL